MIIHRIVSIEEPNEKHPEHRVFRLRGDANRYSDEFDVEYSQMRSIYEGKRIPFVGSFVWFMQSPFGYMCIMLVTVGFISSPIIEKALWKAKRRRLSSIGFYLR